MTYLHLFSWNPLHNPGGMETVINITAKAQAKVGHKVFVVGRTHGDKAAILKKVVDGVNYIQVQNTFVRRPSTLQIGIGGYILLISEILFTLLRLTPVVLQLTLQEKKPFVLFYGIHLFGMSPLIRLCGGKTALVFEALQRSPFVSPFHWLYWFRQIKYACFNAIFTVGEKYYYADGSSIDNVSLLKKYAQLSRVFCFPWGIEVDKLLNVSFSKKYQKLKNEEKVKLIVCPRRLVEEKGVRYLIESIPTVLRKHPKTLFIFTSQGILREELETRAKTLGITKNVIFTGALSYEEVLSIIKTADVMAVPSSGEELFGMVFLEAYVLNVPIVSTWFGGIPNVVKDKKTGLLVKPKDPDKLAEAILYLLNHKRESEMMAKAGHKLVMERFQLTDTVKTLDEIAEIVYKK